MFVYVLYLSCEILAYKFIGQWYTHWPPYINILENNYPIHYCYSVVTVQLKILYYIKHIHIVLWSQSSDRLFHVSKSSLVVYIGKYEKSKYVSPTDLTEAVFPKNDIEKGYRQISKYSFHAM